jgi:SAM-dependent methyltransferase
MLRVLAAKDGTVENFLDLGCGDGILSAAILERWPEVCGVLLDFSEPMLTAARERFGLHAARLVFRNLDYGHRLWARALAAAPFDAVVSGFSIHHQPDEGKRQLYDDYMIDALWEFHKSRGTIRKREQIADEYHHRPDKAANILAPVETQCAWLRDAGFEDVDCYFKVFELAVFGGRRPRA